MREELETLCEVQKLDTKIIENERKRAIGPQRIEEMEREVREARRSGTWRRTAANTSLAE